MAEPAEPNPIVFFDITVGGTPLRHAFQIIGTNLCIALPHTCHDESILGFAWLGFVLVS
ncbi:hypothetical protein EJ04DRAFT_508891 [Polyplosphaeria fusca]|uniref:Uncharacterized protein n=1 Tax=Polyplosphaeria fusca TaxID=682080 RepID=A0A9P4V7C6_9PLEO|nr:hypothetical protein EJ04DRAFT_508891 [Polyplosphaeria fusca]